MAFLKVEDIDNAKLETSILRGLSPITVSKIRVFFILSKNDRRRKTLVSGDLMMVLCIAS